MTSESNRFTDYGLRTRDHGLPTSALDFAGDQRDVLPAEAEAVGKDGVALGIAGAYLLLFLRMWTPAERTHLMEYTVVALLIYEALSERASNGRRVPLLPLLAFLLTALIGVIDEVIQWFLPSRVFEWIDILFNTLAAFMAVLACVALGWARRLTSRLRQRAKGKERGEQ